MTLPLGNHYKSAYVVFAEELKTTLDLLSEISRALSAVEGEAERVRTLDAHAPKLEQRFHTMRGGAGFLKLKQLHQTATEAECLFRQGKVNPPDQTGICSVLDGIAATLFKSSNCSNNR